MATKQRANSVKGSRRWIRIGPKGRATALRKHDTAEQLRPARREPRWAKGAPIRADVLAEASHAE